MKAKEYLQQIEKFDAIISFRTREIENMIEEKTEQIEKWYAIATKTTSTVQTVQIGKIMHGIEKVQSSGSKDSMANAICEALELSAIYVNEFKPIIQCGLDYVKSVEAERNKIIKTLELLPAKEYMVLYKVYVKYRTLDQAADELGKSKRTVDTLHGSGLAKIQRIIDEREEQ